ncbi:Defensin beta [Trichinella pseudospiralis]
MTLALLRKILKKLWYRRIADQENVVSCCKRGRTFQQPLRDIGNSERPPEAALKEVSGRACTVIHVSMSIFGQESTARNAIPGV